MILDNGLKIMSIDATDLFRVEVESTKNKKGKEIKVAKEIVPSGLSSYYDYYDESKDEILHLRNPQLFKMKLDSSMALDELGRVIADRRMTKTAFFNVRRKLATDQVVYLTFKYSSFRSTLKDDKDDKGKVKKYRVDGKTKETIRYMIYDKEDFSFKIDDIEYVEVKSGDSTNITVSYTDSGKTHYVVFKVTLGLNKKAKDYSTKSTSINNGMKLIVSQITNEALKYSYNTVTTNKTTIEKNLLSTLQDQFETEAICSVTLSEILVQ